MNTSADYNRTYTYTVCGFTLTLTFALTHRGFTPDDTDFFALSSNWRLADVVIERRRRTRTQRINNAHPPSSTPYIHARATAAARRERATARASMARPDGQAGPHDRPGARLAQPASRVLGLDQEGGHPPLARGGRRVGREARQREVRLLGHLPGAQVDRRLQLARRDLAGSRVRELDRKSVV